MSETLNIVRGTIRDDGTLELAEPLTLPAGAVEVTVRPVVAESQRENWFADLQRTREELEARDSLHSERPASPVPPIFDDSRKETLWEFMQRSRAELEASGHQFRTKEEIDADIEEMRDWDGKVEEVYRQAEEERQRINPK